MLYLLGSRQVGKTSLAKHLRPDWRYFDLEKPSDLDLVVRDPELFFDHYSSRVIIDEAQEYPPLFKILRGVIDADRKQKNRFIVTGSSSPEITEHLSDSLAGRVGIVQVGTLKANEYFEKPLSDFYKLFTKKHTRTSLKLGPPLLSNAEMRHCWMYGGYPEPLLAQDALFFQDWMNNYYATYINRDISRLFPRLNKISYQRFISTLSSLSGTVINKADLARAIEVSEKSVTEYLEIAEQTYIWRNIEHDSHSKIKSLVKRPKGLVRDSGLQHFLQKINDLDQLLTHPNCGHSFESFIIEEIIKGALATGNVNLDFQYYRTAKGGEVDLIVSSPAGIIPIEIKMGKTVTVKQLASLTTYIENNNLPFGIVLNQSDHIIWLTDKILQAPVGVL